MARLSPPPPPRDRALSIPPTLPPSPEDSGPWRDLVGVEDILSWALRLFPARVMSAESVRDIVTQAYQLGSSIYGAEAAVQWADGFAIPRDSVLRDSADLQRHNGSLRALVKERLTAIRAERFNRDRVMRYVSADNPERDKLLLLAEGMRLYPDPGYSACPFAERPALSRSFVQASAAVEKMFYRDFWQDGLAILLPASDVQRLERVGFCLAGWAKKQGKPCGRPITNGSGRRQMLPCHILNSPHTKEVADQIFGAIEHPTIADAVHMVQELCDDEGCSMDDILLWKFDLHKAYCLLTYAEDDIELLCVELSDGTFLFFLVGVFGLTGMPVAFHVVTRAIVFEVRSRITGRMIQYVDDALGASLRHLVDQDMAIAFAFVRQLLGEKAIEATKTVVGSRIDFIGYELRLDEGLVCIAKRNALKALFAFLNIDLDGHVRTPVVVLQGIASLASRYSYITFMMRPFTKILYRSFAGQSHHRSIVLDDSTKRVIRFFRFLLAMSLIGGREFSRPMESLRLTPPAFICEYDASLSGVGVLYFRCTPDGEECIAYASIDITAMGFGDDSSWQNTAEYLAGLLAEHGLLALGHGGAPSAHRGDSTSSLSWTRRGTAASLPAIRVCYLWGLHAAVHNTHVVSTIHISSARNRRADILSRHGTWNEVLLEDSLHFGGRLRPDTPRLHLDCHDLLRLCNPRQALDTDDVFNTFLSAGLAFFTQ